MAAERLIPILQCTRHLAPDFLEEIREAVIRDHPDTVDYRATAGLMAVKEAYLKRKHKISSILAYYISFCQCRAKKMPFLETDVLNSITQKLRFFYWIEISKSHLFIPLST